jgi:hypothetical protein
VYLLSRLIEIVSSVGFCSGRSVTFLAGFDNSLGKLSDTDYKHFAVVNVIAQPPLSVSM